MARSTTVALSDFTHEDQQILAQHAQAKPATSLDGLLAFAKENNLRVTSSNTGQHNRGSKHYRGEAIDVDHRGQDFKTLSQRANSAGYRLVDERQRPAGQKVWDAPHFHLETNSAPVSRDMGTPKTKGHTIAQTSSTDMSQFLPLGSDANGNLVPHKPNAPAAVISSSVASGIAKRKTSLSAPVSVQDFDLTDEDKQHIASIASGLKEKPQAPVVQEQPQTNFFGDAYNHAVNAAAGYSQDDLIRNSGHGWGAAIGDIAGGLVPIGAGSAAGAGLGSAVPVIGTAAGAIGGGIAGAGSAGVAQDLQVQRLEGIKNPNIGRALGSGAIQGALQAIPVVGKGAPLLEMAAKNAVLHGGLNAAGAVAQQGVEQGTATPSIDWNRVKSQAGLGAAGGAIAGGIESRFGHAPTEMAPAIATESPIPQYKTQADVIRNLANIDNAERIKNVSPVDLKADWTDPVNQREMAQSFRKRGGMVPGDAPKGNVNAQIVDTSGRPIQSKVEGVNKTPYEIALERTREMAPTPAPQIEVTNNHIPNRTEISPQPAPNLVNPITGKPYDMAPPRAAESAQVLGQHMDDIQTAQQLHNEATNHLRQSEQRLLEAGQSSDQVEAQRNVGARINELEAKAEQGAITEPEVAELNQHRQTLDQVLNARKSLQDAQSLLEESQAHTPRSTVEAPAEASAPPPTPEQPGRLKTSAELAMERVTHLENTPSSESVSLSSSERPVKGSPSSPLLDAQGRPSDMAGGLTLRRGLETSETPRLLDATGKPLSREMGTGPKLLDSEGKPLEMSAKPEAEPIEQFPGTKAVYDQGRPAENVDALTQALEKNSQIVAVEQAKKLLAAKKTAGLLSPAEHRAQTDVLNLFSEAGRTGREFNATRREIKEGMGTISRELGKAEVKNRDSLAPFAITVRERKPGTEVSNLMKRLGTAEAVRDQLRQVAGRYGITPTTEGRTVRANAVKIAEQIASNPKGKLEFQDIYLNAHNFKSGGIKSLNDAPRNYPLRTFESGNIGAGKVVIPEGALNKNAIAQHFDALEALKNSPDINPEMKQAVTKVTESPNPSFNDIRKMRELIGEKLEQFCKIWNLQ